MLECTQEVNNGRNKEGRAAGGILCLFPYHGVATNNNKSQQVGSGAVLPRLLVRTRRLPGGEAPMVKLQKQALKMKKAKKQFK